MRTCIVEIALLSFAACGGPAPQTPSDVDFLAARATGATRIIALFDANDVAIAPHPEGAGPIHELDPAEFSAARTCHAEVAEIPLFEPENLVCAS